MKVSNRERILGRRKKIAELASAERLTTKQVAKRLGVHFKTIVSDVGAMDDVHWQDCYLYYGVKL